MNNDTQGTTQFTTKADKPTESELVIAEAREEVGFILKRARENRAYAEHMLVALLIAHDSQLSAAQGEAERLREFADRLGLRAARWDHAAAEYGDPTSDIALDAASHASGLRELEAELRAIISAPSGANRGGA